MAKLTPRQRLYIRKRTKVEEADPSESEGELNIVPFMDILVVILSFLLMASLAIAFFAEIHTQLPEYSRGGVGKRSKDKESLNLNLTITDNGVVVTGSGGKLAQGCKTTAKGRVVTVPKSGGDYDWSGLTQCVAQVHTEFPDESQVTVTADPLIEFQYVVSAMDAVRACPQDSDDAQQLGCEAGAQLFPDVLLSAGVR